MTDPKAEAAAQEALNAVLLDYVAVFSTEPGQRVLRHIERLNFVHDTTVVPGDAHGTLFHEGKRAAALSIRRHFERGQLLGTLEEPKTVTPSIPHEEGT